MKKIKWEKISHALLDRKLTPREWALQELVKVVMRHEFATLQLAARMDAMDNIDGTGKVVELEKKVLRLQKELEDLKYRGIDT